MINSILSLQIPPLINIRHHLNFYSWIAQNIHTRISPSWYTILFVCHCRGTSSPIFQKRTAQDSLGSIPPIPAIPLPRVWVFTGITKCSALRSPFLVLLIVRKHPLWFGLTPLPSWLNMNRGVPLIMMLPLEVSLTPYIPFTTNYWTPYTIINQRRSIPSTRSTWFLVHSPSALPSREPVHG